MKHSAAFGAFLWAGLAAASQFRVAHRTAIELLFLLAPLVVVPLGLELCGRLVSENFFPLGLFARQFQFPAAICLIASFWISPGDLAAILVLPWLCVGLMTAFVALKIYFAAGTRSSSRCA